MIDMSRSAITARIREVADRADLRAELRLVHKLDMTPAGITARLAAVESLRRLCVALGEIGRNNGLVR